MTLYSIGRRLKTVGGKTLNINNSPLIVNPQDANRCPPFSQWTLTSGATVDSNGVLTFNSIGATATSPFLPADGLATWTFSAEVYCDNQSPSATFQPNSSRLYSSSHFAADKTTPANNTSGYSGNGNAASIPRSAWSPRYTANGSTQGSWTNSGGPQVMYVRIIIAADASWIAPPISYRLPMFTAHSIAVYPQYSHWYLKGI